MDKDSALRLHSVLLQASASLHETIEIARGALPEEDFKSFCQVVGAMLGSIQIDILSVWVFPAHPDLKPRGDDLPVEETERLRQKSTEVADRLRKKMGADPKRTLD